MGHIHSLKFKFRPPVPDIYISNIASFEKQDMQAHGNSAFWLSSTVPGHLVWPASGDGLEDKTNYLFRRQSTCALEVDASVDDILNQKYRMYTSLSQTRSDVKMVQSLVAIWEEEYERSGTPAAVKSTDQSKPTPENVLASFTHGLDYEKALDELCAIEKSFPHSMSTIKQGGKVEDTFKSSISSGKESALLGYQSSCIDPVGPLKCIGEEKNFVSLPRRYLFQESRDGEPYVNVQQFDGLKSTSDRTLSDVDRIAEEESLDTEALGLLRWLTSSQAAKDFNADDELVNEAILSPLLSAKSYKEALEMAHFDYESASQKECQDILDSLEEFSGFEGFKERVSHFTHEDSTSSFSSDNVIPQNDGAFDDEFRTPQKDDISEANINSGRDKDSAHGTFSITRSGSKRKRSKLSWGQLPFCFKEAAENPEPAFIIHCQNEMKNDDDSSSSSGIKSSVRDLMRRKRCLRTEQSDKIGSMHYKPDREDYNAVPHEGPDIESFRADNGFVHENATCSIACTMDACIKEDGSRGIDYCSPTNQKPLVTFCSGEEIQSIMQIDGNLHLQKLSTDDITDATNESKKVLEPFQSENLGTSLSNMISGSPQNVTTDTSLCSIRTCNSNSPAESEKCTSSIEINPSTKEDLNKCVSHSIDELLVEKLDVCTVDLTTTHVEQTLMHDPGKYKESHDDEVVTERGFKKHTNCRAKLDFTLHRNVQRSKNNVCQGSRDNLDFDSTCSDLLKGGDTHDCVEMTFGMIPPSRDDVDKFSLDSPEMMGHVESYVDLNANRQHVDNFLLISPWKFEDGISYERLNDENLAFNQEPVLGVPTHFQNDGSVLYLLTPAVVPPTMETVHQWLSELQDSSPNSSGGDACDVFSPESNAAASHVDPELHEQHVAGTHSEKNVVNVDSHDFSQISGPDTEEKSNLTPLSQMGFRDTASTGGGQQLTLISMEIQAESRRDLRPDPKVDAINVISLVIQDDSSHKIEVFVLMRGQIEEQCWRNVDGLSNCKFSNFNDEKHLLDQFVKIISSFDPDILLGWEIQGGSLGFIVERAAHFGISLLKKISRTPKYQTKCKASDSADPDLSNNEAVVGDTAAEYSLLENEWSQAHASGIHVSGRIVLNIWQLMRSELKLHMYSAEAVAQDVLRRKIPSISYQVLNEWFLSGPGRARHRCIEYVIRRAKLNLEIMNQLDMINRTSELARVFGIDFFSVLSRGSQFRVESMLLRLAHTQNYVAISPGNQQVASQPAMECLPLVMEPKSGFYADPVVVLDFQSLYPSMIIGYNLCYTTCLGSVVPSKSNVLGVTSYLPNPLLLKELKQQLLVTPNGIMYVPSKVRRGVLPRLLEEILSTRIMVKQAMKKLLPSQQILQRILNARQLALKLIANVTYGYTAAGFSGRMPCAELADSIVQCGRRTLETAISFVNRHDRWKATVIYGDTDSMFVLLKDRSREDAFRIGNEIASAISAMNPDPVTLKMEKIYQPCFLLTKKRYVGYSYESPDQEKPIFDAKGIETVRRDTCPAVAKILERSIRLFFEHQNITEVKNYLLRQWRRTLRGKISLQDFIFSKEVRLGSYSSKASSLPPAAIVAIKAMQTDRRASPHYGERIPYVVIHGEPGARLVDMVINPYLLLDINSPYRLNELYYIKKQIIPALQRVFGLVGVDLNQWFSELPRSVRQTLAKSHSYLSFLEPYECDKHTRPESFKMGQLKRSRIDTYYISKHCTLCGELAHASDYLCDRCSNKRDLFTTSVVGKASRLEREIQHLAAICRHCGGGDWIIENGVKCTSLACSVFYERQKVQKDLQSISSFATAVGLYPRCIAEWF